MSQNDLPNLIEAELIRFSEINLSDDISRELVRDAIMRVILLYMIRGGYKDVDKGV